MLSTIKDHKLFGAIFIILLLVRVPALFYSHEYVVASQDYNAVHLGMLYCHNDIPAADDSDIGANARYLSFSSANYLIPLIGYKIGIPFEFFVILHMLFGLPLLLLLIYILSFILFADKWLASFSALYFYFGEWVFNLNNGYTIIFDKCYYLGDINSLIAVLFIILLLQGRIIAAAASVFTLSVFNPTYGITGAVIYLFHSILNLKKIGNYNKLVVGAGIVFLGVAVSYIMVKIATPHYEPISDLVRNFCIQSYSHIAPHVTKALLYWNKMAMIFGYLALVILWEKYYRNQALSVAANSLSTARSLMFVFLIYSILLYFILYIYNPVLFIELSPSKSLMMIALFLSPYVCFVIYNSILCRISVSLLAILVYAIMAYHYKTLILSQMGSMGWIYFAVANCVALILFYKNFCRHKACTSIMQKIVIVPLLIYAIWMPLASANRLKSLAPLYDLEIKMNNALPKEAILMRHPSVYSYGAAVRTYSRRGLISYVPGRNAYFNSLTRQKNEEKIFGAAGIDIWGAETIGRINYLKANDWWLYHTGISFQPRFHVINSATPPAAILYDIMGNLARYLNNLDLNGFYEFGRKVGATHIIVARNRGLAYPQSFVVIENRDLAVIKIPLSEN